MRRRTRYLAVSVAVATAAAVAMVTASAGSDSPSLPALVPTTATPNINDGTNNQVEAVTRVGSRVIIGGVFQSATNPGSSTAIPRTNILAFDPGTGTVDAGFAPSLNGEVTSLLPGPNPDTVYVGGAFNIVNGAAHYKLVELNTTDGSVVSTFAPAAFDGSVKDLAAASGRLYVGGIFTKLGKIAHAGLATVNAITGATDAFMNVQLAGHHNYNGTGAKAATGVERFDLSPDGSKLVVVGNFKTVNGLAHDQGVLIDLTGASAAVLPWYAAELTVTCNRNAFDDWVRDVAFSPDSSYFVIVGTGGPSAGMCDAATRFETADSANPAAHSTWIDKSGGDSFYSVAVTSSAVYVGGHFRWLNNSFGHDSSAAGAVGRASIGALDPKSGIPMAWNPGRNPRGFGILALYVDPNGLYIGSDTNYLGYAQYLRAKIAFLPFAGGHTPPAGQVATLPATIYQPGVQAPLQNVFYRVNVGGPAVSANDGGPDWIADNGASSPYRNSGGATISTTATTISKVDPSVPASTPLQVFSNTRIDPSASPDMIWTFPVAAGMPVKVRLYFADRAFPAYQPGQRVFNVAVNGTVVDPNFDINGTVGYNTAVMREYPVTSNGSVVIDFQPVADKPEVSAIEIVRNGGPTTGLGIGGRTFDGVSVGQLTPVGGSDGTPWQNERGAFLVDHTLYYGMSDGNLYKRTFDGTNLGPVSLVNPFSDPFWDGKSTGSGTSTYSGVKSSFYGEITSITSMYYDGNGKLYYTRSGLSSLYWRWFSPDSAVTGADEFTATGTTGFNTTAGVLFISGGNLYFAKSDGNLYQQAWTGSTTSGSATAISGPGIDGNDWHSLGSFIGS